MQQVDKNKMMGAEEVKNKVASSIEDYHFPGNGECEPITIAATSRAEAEEIHKVKKVLITK